MGWLQTIEFAGISVSGPLVAPTNGQTLVYSTADGRANWATVSGGGGGSTAWADLTGVPSTFPPVAHAHAWADITSGVPSTFPPVAHVHAWADITSGVPAFGEAALLDVGTGPGTVCAGDDERFGLTPAHYSTDNVDVLASVTVTGGTLPSGAASCVATWRTDYTVHLWIQGTWATAGVGNTGVILSWPTDLPVPTAAIGTGFDGVSEQGPIGMAGAVSSALSTTVASVARCQIVWDASGAPQIRVAWGTGSLNLKTFWLQISFPI